MMIIILLLILLLIVVVLVRTINFKPRSEEKREYETIEFDKQAAVSSLASLVKCKTVSYYDHSKEDNEEFEKLVNLLPSLYPSVCKNTTLSRFDGHALLFHWKGKESGDPAIFMAHYDVVPVEEENWSKPAFEALIEDGAMWGRGTLDTKVTFNGIMSASENLISQGFVPKNDVYFAFSGGEEVSGIGASEIVKFFKENNITPGFVIDEGGAVVQGVFPGLKKPCGLIGMAEKGSMNLRLVCKSNGGHASAPKPDTPLVQLSKACLAIENHPFVPHYTMPILKMFDELGRRSTFLYRMIFGNLWCFKKILDIICKKSGGELNALVRTTTAFTQTRGSDAPNVLPPSAEMTINIRINPEDSVDSVVTYLKKIVNNPNIEFVVEDSSEPSRISTLQSDGYKYIKNAVEDTWKGCVVSPYLMIQASDSKHYGVISDKVYRFSALDLTAEERASIHGNDERIRLETLYRSVEFFIRVMKNC